jgi:regulatory protein
MAKITQVERQKNNPTRFNIFLDGTFGFGADEDTVVTQRLVVGKELDATTLDQVVFEAEVGKLMDRLYALLSRRSRSEKEMRDYLTQLSFKRKIKDQAEISSLAVESAISRLKKKGLLNDLEFARNWVESRGKKHGPNRLRQELMLKGVEKEIIDQILAIESAVDRETDTAKMLLEKKLKAYAHLPEREGKQKAILFLMRRGFDYQTAREVVDQVFENI